MRADGGVCIPEIVTSEIDVLPSEWSDVDEQRIWHGLAMATHGIHRRAILRSTGSDGSPDDHRRTRLAGRHQGGCTAASEPDCAGCYGTPQKPVRGSTFEWSAGAHHGASQPSADFVRRSAHERWPQSVSPQSQVSLAYFLAIRLSARVIDFACLLGRGMADPVDATR